MNPKVINLIEDKEPRDIVDLCSEKTIINTFDMTLFDDLDPVLSQGFKEIFNREVEVEIKKEDKRIREDLRIRVLYLGDESAATNIRLEISSENDLYFYYLTEIDSTAFRKLKDSQRLQCQYYDFLPTIRKLLTVCIPLLNPNPGKEDYKLCMNIKTDSTSLDFTKLMSHKEISVLSLKLLPVSNEFMKRVITYKFNYARSMIALIQDRIKVVNELVETKNPILYHQIQKRPAKLTEEFIQSKTKSNFFKYNVERNRTTTGFDSKLDSLH